MNLKILIGFGVLAVIWWMNPSLNETTRHMYLRLSGDVPSLVPFLYVAAHLALLLAFTAYTFKLAVTVFRSGLKSAHVPPSERTQERQRRVLVHARLNDAEEPQRDAA